LPFHFDITVKFTPEGYPKLSPWSFLLAPLGPAYWQAGCSRRGLPATRVNLMAQCSDFPLYFLTKTQQLSNVKHVNYTTIFI